MIDYSAISGEEAINLPPEEFAAWLAWEPERPPISSFALHTNEGRVGFLEEYIWRGDEALFEAVNVLWDQLCDPKPERCFGIGLAAGTGGTGKWALAKFLKRALRESLDYDCPQPCGKDYPSIHEFHQASMEYFAADRAHYERTVQKYADLLVADPFGAHVPKCKILPGPWADADPTVSD